MSLFERSSLIRLLPAIFIGSSCAFAQLAAVSVTGGSLGRRIPNDFLGLSIELQNAKGHYFGTPDQPNRVFFQMIQNLGPGTLRLGGNSQDESCWLSAAAAPIPTGCYTVLSPDDFRSYGIAASATGWKLIFGLNLGQNAPSWALQPIIQGLVPYVPREQLLALEIGNEPDHYRTRPFRDTTGPNIRPSSYSYRDHISEFSRYVNSLRSDTLTANLPISGPSYSGDTGPANTGWRDNNLGSFLDSVGRSNFSLVTVHNYATSRNNYMGRSVRIDDLLSQYVSDNWTPKISAAVAVAASRGLDLQISETNSANIGGMPGVSDTMAAALWGLTWMFDNATAGVRRINFHTGRAAAANAIQTDVTRSGASVTYHNVARPLYYAMLMFSNAEGQAFLPVTVQSRANVRAYALTQCSGCPVSLFVVNKDMTASGAITVKLNSAMGAASLLVLKAPSLESIAGDVSYGGQQISSITGLLTGPPQTAEILSDASGVYSFNLDRASVAMLTIQPGIVTSPSIAANGIVNSASFVPAVAPGSIASIFGQNLALATASANYAPLPSVLAGASLQLTNATVPVIFTSPGQINFQLPWEAAASSRQQIAVKVGSVTTSSVNMAIVPFAPAIFSMSQTGTGQGAILHNGTATLAGPTAIGATPARPGQIISIYCTGLGAVNNQPRTGSPSPYIPLAMTMTQPAVTIGGVAADVVFSGLAPGLVGLYQVNARVPENVLESEGVPVSISIGGATSNTVTIAVRR